MVKGKVHNSQKGRFFHTGDGENQTFQYIYKKYKNYFKTIYKKYIYICIYKCENNK